MQPDDVRRLLNHLTGNDPIQRAAARLAFLRMDENAVQPLADELYSGVNEATGVAILELLSEIGGVNAIAVLCDIYFAASRPALVRAAARGLEKNGRHDLLR